MTTKYWTFPAGERGVAIGTESHGVKVHTVKCNFKGSDSIIDMLLNLIVAKLGAKSILKTQKHQ